MFKVFPISFSFFFLFFIIIYFQMEFVPSSAFFRPIQIGRTLQSILSGETIYANGQYAISSPPFKMPSDCVRNDKFRRADVVVYVFKYDMRISFSFLSRNLFIPLNTRMHSRCYYSVVNYSSPHDNRMIKIYVFQ